MTRVSGGNPEQHDENERETDQNGVEFGSNRSYVSVHASCSDRRNGMLTLSSGGPPTQRVAEALTGLHVDPAQSVCGCYELTPEDARQLARAVVDALQLTEEWGWDIKGRKRPNPTPTDEESAKHLVSDLRPYRRLVTPWIEQVSDG